MIPTFSTLSPNWTIPKVKAYTILSRDFDSNAVSFSQDDLLGSRCKKQLELLLKPSHPMTWLRQVHGCDIVELPASPEKEVKADGAFTLQKKVVCTVVTADCLPIVFADKTGGRVGVVHAGRKGLQNGIIFEMIRKMNISAKDTFVWIGPGIAAESYPISSEIREEVLALSSDYTSVFTKGENEQYLMNLYQVAHLQLASRGIPPENIDGATWNTFTDERFHSARRDHAQSGRMATIVWME